MYKLPLYLVLSHLVLGAILDHPSNRTTSLCPNGGPNERVPLYFYNVFYKIMHHFHHII